MKKRLLSLLLVIVMLMCSMPVNENVFDLFAVEASAASFTPRTTAPTTSNSYYYSKNIFYTSGWGMPNCTCYAYGRAYEILGSKPKLSTGNAGGWWLYNKNNGFYPYGQTPKLGAIAVWDKYNNNGHVAVVEGISGNTITISESHYGGTFFNTRNIKSDSSDYLQSYRFLGYIYIIDAEPHKVDSNYGKNYTTNLKNPSGKTTVYSSCGIVASGHYISGNDPVTIHEVYTDGCCKVSYTTDSGATRTYYAKISDFKPKHTHSYTKYYEAAHPHKEYMKCSCDDWYYLDTNKTVSTCSLCKAPSSGKIWFNEGNKYYCNDYFTINAKSDNAKEYCFVVTWMNDSGRVGYTGWSEKSYYSLYNGNAGEFTVHYLARNDYGTYDSSSDNLVLSFSYIEPTIKIENGSSEDMKIGDKSKILYTIDVGKNAYDITYSSDNTSVATVSSSGVITANSVGKATITAKLVYHGDEGDYTAKATMIVNVSQLTYAVKYDANGGLGSMENSIFAIDTQNTLRGNQFIRSGYVFLGWSTDKNATTATYTDKQSVKNLTTKANETVTLYAVWKPNTYTVKYNANGGSGAPENQSQIKNNSIKISNIIPIKNGYSFIGWSLDKNANSVDYIAGDSFFYYSGLSEDVTTLYAVWEPNTYTVKYDANNGSGSMSSSTHTYDELKNLSANQFSRTGYTFLGWSTDKLATIATYTDKQSVKNLTSTSGATVTLYAVWESNTYTLTYESNGGEKIPDKQQMKGYGWISTQIPEKTGYTFLGWDALESASNVQFNPGDGIIILADTSVYAVWQQNTYTIKYDANNGIGSMSSSTHTYDELKNLSANQFSRTGYEFLGWSTDKNATTATYTDKQSVKNLTSTSGATVTLYAVWKVEKQKTPIIVYFDGNGVELDWDSVTVPYDGKLSLSDIQTPVRKGYKFVRWSARDYDSLLAIGNGIYPSLIYPFVSELPKEITLYAIWEEDISLTECEKNGHVEEIIPAKAPACTVSGLTEGKKCTICDTITLEQTVISATGHTDEVIPAVDPTCTEAGLTEGKKCSVCGEIIIAQENIPATGHTLAVIPGKEATETETGLTEGEKCSVCDTVTKAQEIIPVIEKHKHNHVATVTAPTCTSQGFTTFTCACGDSYVGEYVGYAAHTEVVISGKSATCTSSGLTDGVKCSVCNKVLVEQRNISALGHNPGNWETVKAAEIGKEGKEQQKCQICKVVLNEKILPALEPVGYEIGDVNNDGKITAADARTVLRASAKLETLDENAMVAADVNKDKKITAADARTILRVSAKLESF